MPTRLKRGAEWSFSVCALLLLPGSTVVWPGILLALFGVIFLALIRHWGQVRMRLHSAWPVLLPVLLAAGSVSWSIEPGVSLYRAVALAGTTAFGFFLVIRFHLEDQLKLLALVLGLVACASILVVIFLPQYGMMSEPHAGAWSGIFYNKNPFGRIMALAVIVFCLLALGSTRLRFLSVLGLALCMVSLLDSWSRTAILVAIACLSMGGSLYILQRLSGARRITAVLVMIALGMLISVWAAPHTGTIIEQLGNDKPFRGRTKLWRELIEKVHLRPWLGYGYGAFWHGSLVISEEVRLGLKWYPVHAHNGFLDLTLELGITGLTIFLVLLGGYGHRAFIWGMRQKSPLCLWPPIYLTFFVLSNLTESALVRENSLYWTLFVAAVVTVLQEPLPLTETTGVDPILLGNRRHGSMDAASLADTGTSQAGVD